MSENQITSPLKAIREKCLDCCCGSQIEVKECVSTDCPLFSFRFGKNPFRKMVNRKPMTEEHKQKLREAAKKAREGKKNDS